jgi:hypothetical protein
MRKPLFSSSDIVRKEVTTNGNNPLQTPAKQLQPEAKATKIFLREKYQLDQINKGIAEVIGEPEMGLSIHFTTGARWSAHNLLHYLLKFTGPADVTFATWSMSEDAVRLLLAMKESGMIKEINCLLDKRIKVRAPASLQLAEKQFNRLQLKSCHAKATIIENETWQIAVIGSANYSINPRIETGIIFCSREAAEFHKGWIMDELTND